MYLIFWGIVIILTIVAELMTMQLVSIWFTCGAFGSFLAAMFGCGFITQLGIFVIASALLLVLTRPLFHKIKVQDQDVAQMNAQRDIGATAVVIEEINPSLGTGRAKVNGVDWIAVSENGNVIAKDRIVTITQIDGAKLIVAEEQ